MNPTSDFEEELSFSEIEDEKQIIDIAINVNGKDLKTVSLLITRQGVAKLSSDIVSTQLAKTRKTTIPIQIGKRYKPSDEKSGETLDGISVTSDLASSSSSCLPSPQSQDEHINFACPRSLSPVKICYLENRPALIRQKTFTESSCQTIQTEGRVEVTETGVETTISVECTETQTKIHTFDEINTQTDIVEIKESCIQCLKKAESVEIETQTVDNDKKPLPDLEMPEDAVGCVTPLVQETINEPVKIDAFIQTEHILPDTTDVLIQTNPLSEVENKSPCPDNFTQTDLPSVTDSKIQTSNNNSRQSTPCSPNLVDRNNSFVSFTAENANSALTNILPHPSPDEQAQTEKQKGTSYEIQISPVTSPRSPQTIDRNNTFVKQSLTDEIVSRVLLEHVDEQEDFETVLNNIDAFIEKRGYQKSSESDPGVHRCSAQSTAFSIDGSKALSDNNYQEWNDLMKIQLDISRSVNYMDLSKLGNEGETPNSEEMWVNVEDDNKFLTSDTETYSVATDKVSTMATFRGHVVGANADMSHLMRSVSEAELLELGNESLLSDVDGQQYSNQDLVSIFRSEMEPIKYSLNNTDQTITGIAGTLCNIQDGVNTLCCNITQIKSKVLSSGMDETRLFNESEEKLVQNGKPNENTNELVDMVMSKIEKIFMQRDDQLQNAIQNLREDNNFLRKELEVYREKDSSESKLNNELEVKMQEVIDNMKTLKDVRVVSSSTSAASRELKKESRRKIRKRSKSKTKDIPNRKLSHSSVLGVEIDGYTSSDESVERLPKQSPILIPSSNICFIDSEQQTINIELSSKEIQTSTISTNESSTLTDIIAEKGTINKIIEESSLHDKKIEESNSKNKIIEESTLTDKIIDETDKVADSSKFEISVDVPSMKAKEKISKKEKIEDKSGEKRHVKGKETKLVKVKPDIMPSKTDCKSTKTESRKSRSKQRKSLVKENSVDEVTVSSSVQGQRLEVEGGVAEEPIIKKVVENPSILENKEKDSLIEALKEKAEKNISPKEKNKVLKTEETKVKVPTKDKSKSLERSSLVKKKDAIEKTSLGSKKKLKDDQSSNKMKKSATEPNLAPQSTPMSKIIEGDDFKITITSNQELASCEFSDMEDPSSPRKKIIVTPKPPDKKNDTKGEKRKDKKMEDDTLKKNKKSGKIPIGKNYIKEKTKVPAPEQYPVARPPASQIPKPSVPSSSMSPSIPLSIDIPGYNHNLPPSPTHDYSICSNTYPISGRNTQMSMEEFTMMIKQDSRDSNVYDAPCSIPDYFNEVRESPDGAYSYVLDGRMRSSMSNISDLRYEMDDDSESLERDVLMEFVMMEERMERTSFRAKGQSPFRGYAERIKQKIMREFVSRSSDHGQGRSRIMGSNVQSIPLPGRRANRRKLWKTRSHSVSNEKLTKLKSSLESARELIQSKRNCFSTDRLPNLTSAEEERIIRIKKYEDDTEKLNESRRHYNLRRLTKDAMKNKILPDKDIIIFESAKPDPTPISDANSEAKEPDSGIESQGSKESFSDNIPIESSSDSGKEHKNPKLQPMEVQSRTILSPDFPPLSVECFIVSRGWQIDQAQLTKALAKLEGINFVRMQVANTMNRVLENIRPNNDVVLVHIGTQELGEACHSISNEESIAGYHIFCFTLSLGKNYYTFPPLKSMDFGVPARNTLIPWPNFKVWLYFSYK